MAYGDGESKFKETKTIDIALLIGWHTEEVDRLELDRSRLEGIRISSLMDENGPEFQRALGRIEGRDEVLDGLTAFVLAQSGAPETLFDDTDSC